MIRVKNRKVIRNLSRKTLKANRLRNLVAIFAIILTATMFTALFTIATGTIDSAQRATMRMVGTETHAGFKFLTESQYETLKKDPKIKDISYNIIVGSGENPELKKIYTEIRWTEEKDAKWSFTSPTTGHLPEKGLELATDTTVLDALGVPHKIGETVHLEFSANGKKYSEDFELCGFWEGDPVMGAHEAYVSREYCDRVAPAIQVPLYESMNSDYAGTVNPSFWFSSSYNIEGQVNDLMERCDFDPQKVNSGVNWAYATSSIDAGSILLVVGVLILVLLSGYLIIYNIFYISVSKDIRFYGLLKTIGTTGKQIRQIVRKQALELSMIGIPVGLLIGFFVGKILMPVILSSTNIGAKDFIVKLNPWIFAGSALFALLTVLISCIKPSRLAAKVSPVEAVRYTGVKDTGKKTRKKTRKVTPLSMAVSGLRRERKKVVMVVLSLTLSMVLLNATYTIVHGFDMDKYLKDEIVTDFSVTDATMRNSFSNERNLEGVPESFLEDVQSVPGLESMGNVYVKETTQNLSDTAYENTLSLIDKYENELPMPYAEQSISMAKEKKQVYSFINGIDEALFDTLDMGKGETLDKEKFASGDYVLASGFESTGEGHFYNDGDQVTIDFGNGNKKTYTVLAIGDIPYPLGPQYSYYLGVNFTLPAQEYRKQMENPAPMLTAFNVDDTHVDEAEKWVENYCSNVNSDLYYESKATFVKEFEKTTSTFTIVGGVLSLILGLIGILNFTNAVVTSIHSRRRELAMLQSVGMTGKQLKQMLIWEGMLYAVFTILISVTAGSLLCWLGVELAAGEIWFFSYHFTIVPISISSPFLVVLAAVIPLISYQFLRKQSVVERLRDVE